MADAGVMRRAGVGMVALAAAGLLRREGIMNLP